VSVPGTFKNRPVLLPIQPAPGSEYAGVQKLLLNQGAIYVEFWRCGECGVIVSREPLAGRHYRWHLSISHPSRYPSWDEIKTACYGIEKLQGAMLAQILHPGDGTPWVNLHENCFHLYEVDDPVLAEHPLQ